MSTNNNIHRAKFWEIAFYALINTSTNIYLMLYVFVILFDRFGRYYCTNFCRYHYNYCESVGWRNDPFVAI